MVSYITHNAIGIIALSGEEFTQFSPSNAESNGCGGSLVFFFVQISHLLICTLSSNKSTSRPFFLVKPDIL